MKQAAALLALLCLAAGCASQEGATRAQASAKVHTELAALYYGRAQLGIALDELHQALQAEPNYAPAYNMRGLVRMALNEDREAEADFQHSLSLDGNNADAHNNYGWFLCQRGRERESVPQFMAAVKNPLYATPERAYLNAGVCSQQAGDLKQAGEYLQKALLLRPDMPDTLLALARLGFANSDYASAKSWLDRYAQGVPAEAMNADSLWLAVRIARKTGDRAAEQRYGVQLGKRFPESHEFQLMQQTR